MPVPNNHWPLTNLTAQYQVERFLKNFGFHRFNIKTSQINKIVNILSAGERHFLIYRYR